MSDSEVRTTQGTVQSKSGLKIVLAYADSSSEWPQKIVIVLNIGH